MQFRFPHPLQDIYIQALNLINKSHDIPSGGSFLPLKFCRRGGSTMLSPSVYRRYSHLLKSKYLWYDIFCPTVPFPASEYLSDGADYPIPPPLSHPIRRDLPSKRKNFSCAPAYALVFCRFWHTPADNHTTPCAHSSHLIRNPIS